MNKVNSTLLRSSGTRNTLTSVLNIRHLWSGRALRVRGHGTNLDGGRILFHGRRLFLATAGGLLLRVRGSGGRLAFGSGLLLLDWLPRDELLFGLGERERLALEVLRRPARLADLLVRGLAVPACYDGELLVDRAVAQDLDRLAEVGDQPRLVQRGGVDDRAVVEPF